MADLDEMNRLLGIEPEMARTPVMQNPAVAQAATGSALAQMDETVADAARPSSAAVEDNGMVAMLDRDGNMGTIPSGRVKDALAAGFTFVTPEANHEQVLENKYGDSPLAAGLEGAARSATFGGSDVVLGGLLGEGVAERRKRNSTAAGAGELAGMLSGIGAAGAIGKVGARAAEGVGGTAALEALAGGGTLARAAGRAATAGVQAGVEGALYGAQQTVSDVALSKDPINAEALASELGSNMLYGGLAAGAGGAGLSALGSVARGAAVRARSGMEKWAQRATAEASVPADIAKLDAAGVKEAIKAEKTTLRAGKDTEFTDLRAGRDAEVEALKVGQKTEREAAAKDALGFREELRHAGDELPGLLKKHDLANSGLLKGQDGLFSAQKNFARIVDTIPERPQVGISALRTVERSARNVQDAFAKAGVEGVAQVDALGALADKAGALRSRLESLTAAPASAKLADLEGKIASFDKTAGSDRLSALETHLDNLKNPSAGHQVADAMREKALSYAGGAMGALLGGGPVGALVGAGVGAGFGVLKKRLGSSAAEFSAALGAKLDSALTAVTAKAPAVGRKLAVGLSFGAHADDLAGGGDRDEIHQRARDVLGAVADPAAAQQQIHDGLTGVRSVDNDLADQLETVAMRKLQYLAGIAPKAPTTMGVLGKDRWEPSTAELAKFARVVAVTEKPLRILDALGSDTLTPDVVDAVKAVYPEMFAKLGTELLDRLVQPGAKPLPYARRLGLRMLTGNGIDSTLEPSFVQGMQQIYAQAQATKDAKSPAPSPQAAQNRNLRPTPSQTFGG